MTASLARPAAAPAPGIPWRVALPLTSTALLILGAGAPGSSYGERIGFFSDKDTPAQTPQPDTDLPPTNT